MKRGQSIVEVLIGIAIGAILIVAAAAVIVPALKGGKAVNQAQAGAQLAKELSDNVKSWAAGNWGNVLSLATGSANTYYLNTATSPFSIGTGSTTVTTSTATPAYVQLISSSTGAAATSMIALFPGNVTAGNLLVLGLDIRNTGAASTSVTVTDTILNSWTCLPDRFNAFQQDDVLCYAPNDLSTAADTVKVVIGGSTVWGMSLTAAEYSGVATSSALDVSSSSKWSNGSTTCALPNITNTNATDLIIAFCGVNGNGGTQSVAPSPPYTIRSATSKQPIADKNVTSTGVITGAVFTLQFSNGVQGFSAAFRAGTTSTVTTGSSSLQTISLAGNTFTRYFYLNDVYRDTNGNVTTTISAGGIDPSTKQVTVVVSTGSTTPITYVSYITRNTNAVFNQTSWLGGTGQNNPVTVATTTYYNASSVTIGATGALTLSGGGGSCVY